MYLRWVHVPIVEVNHDCRRIFGFQQRPVGMCSSALSGCAAVPCRDVIEWRVIEERGVPRRYGD